MCAKIFYLILACLFVYVTVTVAAFVYLEWWQAILASAVTLVILVIGAKYLIRMIFSDIGAMAKGLFDIKSRVLRKASVDVHSVRLTEPPKELLEVRQHAFEHGDADERAQADAQVDDFVWYEIEATIFPDNSNRGPMTMWDIDDLMMVPFDSEKPDGLDDLQEDSLEFAIYSTRIMEGNEAVEFEGDKVLGPRRLRFTVGVTKTVKELAFRYYFEQFGKVVLPNRQFPQLKAANT